MMNQIFISNRIGFHLPYPGAIDYERKIQFCFPMGYIIVMIIARSQRKQGADRRIAMF